ncbi:MAG: hypothetical protein HYS74_00005, partial [Parcubacteria group bacterium]|nr:hypothetical protein [Parcubacteria group bacterium]
MHKRLWIEAFGWMLFWAGFIYIWGFRSWTTLELYDNGWWFDALGHAIAGGVLATMMLRLGRATMLRRGVYFIEGAGRRILNITSYNALLAVLWELAEFGWDVYMQPEFFMTRAQAHKGSLDTVLDFTFQTASAFLVVASAALSHWWYFTKYPDAALLDEIGDARDLVAHLGKKISR